VLKTLCFDVSTQFIDASDCDREGDADNRDADGMRDSSSEDFDFAAQVSFTYLFLFIFLDMTKHAVASRQKLYAYMPCHV
jgi:hypothetical protein